jgi:predicted PurR-regulated permease PerM
MDDIAASNISLQKQLQGSETVIPQVSEIDIDLSDISTKSPAPQPTKNNMLARNVSPEKQVRIMKNNSDTYDKLVKHQPTNMQTLTKMLIVLIIIFLVCMVLYYPKISKYADKYLPKPDSLKGAAIRSLIIALAGGIAYYLAGLYQKK